MDHLPVEIIAEILLLAQEGLDDMKEWYRKRLVSPKWRQLIDSSPRMWRRVYLLAGARFVEKQVERAKDVPLWVQADISQREPFGSTWVEAHAGLIERLTMFVASNRKRDSLHVVENMFNATHFPKLRHLRIRRDGPNGSRPFSLPILPEQFVDQSALTLIEFTGISYPISALATHTSLRVLRLDSTKSAFRIALADLQALLPTLPLLANLTLGGILDIEDDDLESSPSALTSLTDFSFFGNTSQLELFFAVFLLPNVVSWRFRLKAGKTGIPLTGSLGAIVKAYVVSSTQVALRWVSTKESQVQLYDGASPGTFALQLSMFRTGPCKILTDLLTGTGSLPSATQLHLHGGSHLMDVNEPNDDVIDEVLEALRNVGRVTISGNGNSWVRIPVVLQRRLSKMDNLWQNVAVVEFVMGQTLPYVVRDWVSLFRSMKRRGASLPMLRIKEWVIQSATPWEARSLTLDLEEVIVRVEGKPYEDVWAVTF